MMAQQNLNFATGRQLRDTGMQVALDHAEEVRAYAYDVLAVPYPPHCRAWGGVIARAAREGLIRRVGLGPVKTASSHMANAAVWRAA